MLKSDRETLPQVEFVEAQLRPATRSGSRIVQATAHSDDSAVFCNILELLDETKDELLGVLCRQEQLLLQKLESWCKHL